jgi:hypothetical protein
VQLSEKLTRQRADAAVLPALGVSVASEEAARACWVAAHPTLFFMPHCEAELTDALLAANAAAGTLCNVAVLGNSCARCCERWSVAPRGRLRPGTLLQLRAGGAVEEEEVAERGFPVVSAFNDMGLHTFGGAVEEGGGGEEGA